MNRTNQVLAYLAMQTQPVTNKTIREATGISRRAVYDALQRLVAEGAVKWKPSLQDTRQKYYAIVQQPLVTP